MTYLTLQTIVALFANAEPWDAPKLDPPVRRLPSAAPLNDDPAKAQRQLVQHVLR